MNRLGKPQLYMQEETFRAIDTGWFLAWALWTLRLRGQIRYADSPVVCGAIVFLVAATAIGVYYVVERTGRRDWMEWTIVGSKQFCANNFFHLFVFLSRRFSAISWDELRGRATVRVLRL